MSVRVRGLEHAGYHMTLRTIANSYLMQFSDLPMTDAEFRYARKYAAMKMDADHYTEFECDEERYVYYGRIIGEEVFQSRQSAVINAWFSHSTDEAEDIEKEPGRFVGPLVQIYSTAFVPQKQ